MRNYTRLIISIVFVLVLLVLIFTSPAFRYSHNDVVIKEFSETGDGGLINTKRREIPIIPDVPKDAIPPLDEPKYVSSDNATWLSPDDIVLGVEFSGDARAYPTNILNWHEIVNDTIGGHDVVITFCPLCYSGIVFDRYLDGKLLSFGNTGALYESAMVMYDRETESYWYQVGGVAIKGQYAGKTLTILPSELTRWIDWQERHPNTKVLSLNTGYKRDYFIDNYVRSGYHAKNTPPAFPVSIQDDTLSTKEKIVGIEINGQFKAYPVELLRGRSIADFFNGKNLLIEGNDTGVSATISLLDNGEYNPAPQINTFWFAWFAAHPSTVVYTE